MKEVRIYTARYCPYCASAKSLLKRKGVSFTEIDIGGNWERRDEMIERANGRVTVPQVFIGGLHVGGVAMNLGRLSAKASLISCFGNNIPG